MANLLKYRLKDDFTWQNFCLKASEVKISLQQTEFAAITPPAQRSKARFMNADILVDWASKMLCLLDNTQEISGIDIELFETQLGWLREYRNAIEHYTRLIQTTTIASHLVRTLGVCNGMIKEFESEVFGFKLSINECQFVGEVIDFLQN